MLIPEVFESKTEPDEWRVKVIDRDGEGECYVTIFSGPQAEERAKTYAALFATDVEATKREAVREFAEELKREFMEFAGMCEHNYHAPNQQGFLSAAKMTTQFAAARGVNLNEKP